uniref:Replication factor A C-terminal domain-containing protein n=1 Tax=Brassica oleracea TaxID=3712 RepID=A0A3P6D4Z2_BRAOL|nr:unnamed protein product [Brassica oleracea]
MNSNSQTPVSGHITAKKPNGKYVISSAEPVKRVGQTGVSLATPVSGDSNSKKPNGKAVVSSAEPVKRAGQPRDSLATAISGDSKSKKPNGKADASSAGPVKRAGQHGVSLAIAVSGDPKSKKPNGKAVVSSSDEVLFFKDVKFEPQEGELRFRLIHFWEARNALTKGTVIQGFIPPNRIETYLPHMVPGSINRLNNFYGSKIKTVYRVAEPDVTIAFSWNFVLSVLENSPVPFPEDRFRFYGYEEFEAACDLRGDLYDYVGHMKLVNEQALSDSLVLDEVEIASSRRILLYIWDKAAADFCEKFKALGKPPTVILVTTVNPKRFGGALSLSSLSSSRVFFDMDFKATREYLAWYVFELNTDVANRVNAEIVTKAETATIGELISYMKQEGAKVAWFECTATIDDVMHGSAWYYISCGGCKTKETKGPTTLMCISRSSVYDNNDHASFVLLGDAGRELTGKKTSELVESYFEIITYLSIIQTRTFVIKVSKHNLDGKTQALTVTKVLPLEVPALEGNIEEDVDEEPAVEGDGAADGTVKRSYDGIESGETKRAKCG